MILWWAILAVAGAATAAWLAGGALASWREQRAGLVYELTPSYRGAALRGGAAAAAVGCVLMSAGGLLLAWDGVSAHGPGWAAAAPAVAADAARPVTLSSPAPLPSATGGLVTVGHPAGGQLLEGQLPGLLDPVRVWLPPQYPGRSAPLRVLVVRADDAQLDDVFEGLASAAGLGRSDPFVAIMPTTPCTGSGEPTGAAASAAGADPAAGGDLRRAIVARFHVASDARSWGLLGLEAGAPCSVATALTQPDSYLAAVGLSGRYDGLVDPGSPADPHSPAAHPGAVRLLLADARRDTAGQASATHLREALLRMPRADVRLSSAVRDFSVERERFRLVRLAAAYLTQQFAAGT